MHWEEFGRVAVDIGPVNEEIFIAVGIINGVVGLSCALVGLPRAKEFTVVDTPLLERLFLLLPPNGVVGLRIACAPNLWVLAYLDTKSSHATDWCHHHWGTSLQSTSLLQLEIIPSTLIQPSCCSL